MNGERRRLTLEPLVVSLAGAAELLNTSEDKVRELVRAGLIAEVPHLSTPAKRAIAVDELKRFVNVAPARPLRAAS